MALPELTLPDGTPPFLAEGHAIELTPLYADVKMQTGHDRKRRIYTTAPRMMNVGWRLSAAQMLAVHEWYEGPLEAGAQWFSAQVANQGPGLLWWKARFLETYTADAHGGDGHFDVTAKLLLVGDGTTTEPYVPNMRASVRIALTGSAALVVPASIGASVSIALLPATFISAAVSVALLSATIGRRVTTAGDVRVLTTGETRVIVE